jgi:hypothetical protein
MNEREIVDRAEVMEDPGDLLPNNTFDEPRWVAEDPETPCRGIGHFELEARVNLVHAVEAYRGDPTTEVGYVSVGRDQTYEMRWRAEDGLGERLRDVLSL